MAGRPNILLVVSDQERQRGWIPDGLTLPHRQRLIDSGLEFTRHYTHSSPCSPSRASLITGRYLPQHGVTDNVIFPAHRELDPAIPTLGSILGAAGYRTSYVGKWHLSHAVEPDLEAYGFPTGKEMTATSWGGRARAGSSIRSSPTRASNGCAPTRSPRSDRGSSSSPS